MEHRRAAAAWRGIERIVVALPPGTERRAERRDRRGGWRGGALGIGAPALAAAGEGRGDPCVVHDAARPLADSRAGRAGARGAGARRDADAAIAAVPVTDTVKQVDGDGRGRETLDRSELWAVQTPQVFRRAALERALDVPEEELARATDDAWLIERARRQGDGGQAPAREPQGDHPAGPAVAELLLAGRLLADSDRCSAAAALLNPA